MKNGWEGVNNFSIFTSNKYKSFDYHKKLKNIIINKL